MTAPQNPYGDRHRPQDPWYPSSAYPGYGQPHQWSADPAAPYGRDPATGQPLSDKAASSAGVLQLFLGWFGVGRLYIGSLPIGFLQLGLGVFGAFLFLTGFFVFAVTWIFAWPFWLASTIWAVVDAIMIFSGAVRDGQGRKLR